VQIEESSVATVNLFGELVAGAACEQLRETFERLADSGHDEIVLDMAEVRYVDSAGIGEIVRCYTNRGDWHGRLELQNVSKKVQALITSELKELSGSCDCFSRDGNNQDVSFHIALQDTECAAWTQLADVIEQAAADHREEFTPLAGIDLAGWRKIVTLPPSIGKLKAVKKLAPPWKPSGSHSAGNRRNDEPGGV
jgi:anti-sigma B factor antagonist